MRSLLREIEEGKLKPKDCLCGRPALFRNNNTRRLCERCAILERDKPGWEETSGVPLDPDLNRRVYLDSPEFYPISLHL